jgi:hypothetical protein
LEKLVLKVATQPRCDFYGNELKEGGLDDMSIISNPATLRAVAQFLLQCADAMHLRDELKTWHANMADVLVASLFDKNLQQQKK